MEYRLEINICTDGDFGFEFIPRDMSFDGEDYSLIKDWTDKTKAFEETLRLCQYLRDNVRGRDYTIEDFKQRMNTFIEHINMVKNEPSDEFFVSESMSGNYDGTEFQFSGQPKFIKCGFRTTDEEYDIIKKGIDAGVTNEMIKEAVIKLCKRKAKIQ